MGRKRKNRPVIEGDRDAICQHFGTCGGCKIQHLSYEKQLSRKTQAVLEAFQSHEIDLSERLLPILGAHEEFAYRNKMEFTFSDRGWLTKAQIDSGESWDRRALGLHVPGRFANVVDIERCYLQNELADQVRRFVADYARAQDLPFHNMIEHTGWLRNLVLRSNQAGQLAVMLIVSSLEPEWIDGVLGGIQTEFPDVVSLYYLVNDKKNSSYTELEPVLWGGNATLTESLDAYHYDISPTAFFQTNPAQAGNLYALVRDLLQSALPEGQSRYATVYDLYCGTGSIGIFVSKLAEKVVGVEYVQASIDDALKNAARNQIPNCCYYAGDMQAILNESLFEKEGPADAMVIDPPRSGMHPKVSAKVAALGAPVIVYVSCNPKTQAHDIASLLEHYELISVQPVDMFPQTDHVESVALLRRK